MLDNHKIALISGPRQVGKTTLAKGYLSSPQNYFTWDDDQFRKSWMRASLASLSYRSAGPVVLDEIHKDQKGWKQKLKGIYDQIGDELQIVVTGSARLDIYRKGADSLMGRYIPCRLHPYTVAEDSNPISPEEIFHKENCNFPVSDLIKVGDFPSHFLEAMSKKQFAGVVCDLNV